MSSSETFKLIQPDLLTHEELVSILRERGVESGLLSQSKDSLVSLYNRVALPLPQREFHQNYRGSLLMKKRKKRERIIIDDTLSSDRKSFTIGTSEPGTSSNSDHHDKSAERLKPPPDMINYDKKTIRLNSRGSSAIKTKSSSASQDLDKVIIKKRKTSGSSFNEVTQQQKIDKDSQSETILSKDSARESSDKTNITISSKEACNGKKVESSSKRVLLKRNNLVSKNPSEDSSNTSSSTGQETNRKRKPITWP